MDLHRGKRRAAIVSCSAHPVLQTGFVRRPPGVRARTHRYMRVVVPSDVTYEEGLKLWSRDRAWPVP